MGFISDFKSTKKYHILKEKVLAFTSNVVSQHESSTKKSEQSVANESTSSKVIKKGLNRYIANKRSSKGEPWKMNCLNAT